MPIDKIGSTERYFLNRPSIIRPKPISSSPNKDSIHLTKAAKQNAELLRIRDMAILSPDLRIRKIEEIRSKLDDPNYPDSAVIDKTADRLLDFWKILAAH